VDLVAPVSLFAVTDPSPSGGELEITSFEDFGVAHGVFTVSTVSSLVQCEEGKRGSNVLLKFTRDDIREDLKLAMTMSSEPSLGSDSIFVDNTKGAKLPVATTLMSTMGWLVISLHICVEKYTYEAKSNVWNDFNQPWSVFPRLWLKRGTILMGAIEVLLKVR